MGGDALLALNLDKVGIYVVFNVVLILLFPQSHPSLVEGHVLGVPVEFELLGVFVELVDVLAGLGHEGDELKLCGEAPFHPFEPEFNGCNFLAEVMQILVFCQPLLRNVIIVHILVCQTANIYNTSPMLPSETFNTS